MKSTYLDYKIFIHLPIHIIKLISSRANGYIAGICHPGLELPAGVRHKENGGFEVQKSYFHQNIFY